MRDQEAFDQGLTIVKKVWAKQPGRYVRVSCKIQSDWKDFVGLPEQALSWLESWGLDADLYWCPHKFESDRAKKPNSSFSSYLWADLDKADPRKFPDHLRPTIAWESSPGKYQGLWKLNESLAPTEAELLNRAVTYKAGADKSGWDLTQVLRVPGTINHKYKDKPPVLLMWDRGVQLKVDTLKRATDNLKIYRPQEEDTEAIISQGNERKVYTQALNRLQRRNKKLFKDLLASDQEVASSEDRSSRMWALEKELVKEGFASHEVFALIKLSNWNKYHGRDDEDHRIATEILKGYQEVHEAAEVKGRFDAFNPHFDLISHSQLMTVDPRPDQWLVKGFWPDNSYGIVAGPPKAYKSWLVHDLAISVAYGKSFLGHSVEREGNVIVVQNENSEEIMRSRAVLMSYGKSLKMPELTTILDGQKNFVLSVSGLARARKRRRHDVYYLNRSGFMLTDEESREKIEAQIRHLKPALVIFDNLYSMIISDLIDPSEIKEPLDWLSSLSKEHSTSIILVHHSKKNIHPDSSGGENLYGSQFIRAWLESAWYLLKSTPAVVFGDGTIERWNEPRSEENQSIVNHIMSQVQEGLIPSSRLITLEREFRAMISPEPVDLLIQSGGTDPYHYALRMAKPGEVRKSLKQPTKAQKEAFQDKVNGTAKRKVPKLDAMQAIMILLSKNPDGLNRTEVLNRVKIPAAQVSRALEKLMKMGWVEKFKVKGNLFFRVSPAADYAVPTELTQDDLDAVIDGSLDEDLEAIQAD